MATPTANTLATRQVAIPSDVLVGSLIEGTVWRGAPSPTVVYFTYSDTDLNVIVG